jgi:hypothetical protein
MRPVVRVAAVAVIGLAALLATWSPATGITGGTEERKNAG